MLPRKCFRYILECLQWLISGTSRSESPIIPVYLRYRIRLSSTILLLMAGSPTNTVVDSQTKMSGTVDLRFIVSSLLVSREWKGSP